MTTTWALVVMLCGQGAESPAPEPAPAEAAAEPAPEASYAVPAADVPVDTLEPTPVPAAADAAAGEAPPEPTLAPSDDGADELAWVRYGVEWSVTAVAGVGVGLVQGLAPPAVLMGPSFSVESPDVAVLFDPRLDRTIGAPVLQEKVPAAGLAIAGLSMWAALAAADGIVHQDLLRVNSVLLGGAEAVVGALVVTEALKLSIGRLRPDFRDRYARAACGGAIAVPDGLDCSTVDADGFVVTRAQLIDGLKSFPSGHASSSFAGATFASLWLGSELVWGPEAPTWGPAVGSLGIAGLLGGAGFIAASRVSDHKHHVEDVVVGSAIGLGAGAAAWLLHFDLDGNRRRTDLTVAPVLIENGGGFALSGPLP